MKCVQVDWSQPTLAHLHSASPQGIHARELITHHTISKV